MPGLVDSDMSKKSLCSQKTHIEWGRLYVREHMSKLVLPQHNVAVKATGASQLMEALEDRVNEAGLFPWIIDKEPSTSGFQQEWHSQICILCRLVWQVCDG